MSLISWSYSGRGPEGGALECGDMVAEKCRTPADRGDCVEAEDDLEKVEEREKVEEEQVVLLLAQRGALLVRYRPREAVRSAPRATMDDMVIVHGFRPQL